MSLLCHLHQLQRQTLDLRGERSAADLGLGDVDELIHFRQPLYYDLRVELINRSLLVQGRLQMDLDCECARCLSPFPWRLCLEPWSALLPLEGDDRVRVCHDSVDLTPLVREDILLALPQHPMCQPECAGLIHQSIGKAQLTAGGPSAEALSTAWAELNKLKL
jgi:uncharacterized protein